MIKKTNQPTNFSYSNKTLCNLNSEIRNEGQLINNLYERKSKQSVNLSTAYWSIT